MVDAGEPPPVRHRLVERIAGRGGAEQFAIAARKRLTLSSSSRVSEAGSRVKPSTRPMVRWVGGIEAADALDLVAEEIEPERLLLARREEIDEAAAHRELAGIGTVSVRP